MRGRYRNSIKVNEPGAQPPVFKVITSHFPFFFFSFPNHLSESGHNRSDPAFIKGGQGQTQHTHTHTRKHTLIIRVKTWQAINLHVPTVWMRRCCCGVIKVSVIFREHQTLLQQLDQKTDLSLDTLKSTHTHNGAGCRYVMQYIYILKSPKHPTGSPSPPCWRRLRPNTIYFNFGVRTRCGGGGLLGQNIAVFYKAKMISRSTKN